MEYPTDQRSAWQARFDKLQEKRIVLHMIGSVGALGKLGLTAIGNTPYHAAELYRRFLRLLDETAAGKR